MSAAEQNRLEIARGLMHSPRVLFLDEPTPWCCMARPTR